MAGIPKTYQKFHQGSQEEQRSQKNVDDALGQLVRNPLLNGRLFVAALNSGTTKIEHKLGRSIQGYIIVNQDAAASVYSSGDDKLFLNLVSSAAVTVSLWVF